MSGRRTWLAAEFDSAERFREAVERLVERGEAIIDACSPYEVSGLPSALGLPRSPLPRVAFIAGLAGALIGYGIQWYVNVWDYPLNAGGRPAHAVPSFVFVTVETIVLCAAASVFVAMLVLAGLPRYYHPLWEIHGFERVSADRFWVIVEPRGAAPETHQQLEALAPLRVVSLEVTR